MKTFIIKYKAIDINGRIIKEGIVKARNKLSRFDAQCSFEEHLKKKYNNFGRLIVESCHEDHFLLNFFDDFAK